MDHVAILRKACIKRGDNLLKDIISGAKTIESRWHANKVAPWNKINKGDTVYLKESGCPVTAKAVVSKVLQYENLTSEKINQIILDYGKQIGPSTTKKEWGAWAKNQTKKRYCILVFLKDVKRIKPFDINKNGYGISSAWLVVKDINKLRK